MRPKILIYTLSDNHFNHYNIIRYCSRPFKTLEEMNEKMIKRWNSVVKPEDIVIHVGDICFTKGESKKVKEILSQLNGRIILVKGNHDRKSYSFYCSSGIDFICERFVWNYNNKKILFVHNPHDLTNADYRRHDFIIVGHSHDKGKFVRRRWNCYIVNVSVEKINYTPMNLNTLLNRVKQGYYDKRKKK